MPDDLVPSVRQPLDLSDEQIDAAWPSIVARHAEHLEAAGVRLPSLRYRGEYTEGALVLVALVQGYPHTCARTKEEISAFVNEHRASRSNDVQAMRHLAAQDGWPIASGTRKDRLPDGTILPPGSFQLLDLSTPYPRFKRERRVVTGNWDDLKAAYGHRCATCSSKEGEPHLRQPQTITRLELSHRDPSQPLTPENSIPQCSWCNKAYRSEYVFDADGRTVAIASPRPALGATPNAQIDIIRALLPRVGHADLASILHDLIAQSSPEEAAAIRALLVSAAEEHSK